MCYQTNKLWSLVKKPTHVPLPIPATFGSRRADRDSFTFILFGGGLAVRADLRFVAGCVSYMYWPIDALDRWMPSESVPLSRYVTF